MEELTVASVDAHMVGGRGGRRREGGARFLLCGRPVQLEKDKIASLEFLSGYHEHPLSESIDGSGNRMACSLFEDKEDKSGTVEAFSALAAENIGCAFKPIGRAEYGVARS